LRLHQEFADQWGERGDLAAFHTDEDRVVRFLQAGYRAGKPPSVEETVAELGADLTALWITGSARNLLDHYLTAERTKLYVAMNVTESGPVSLSEPYSAFIIPMMSSGSVFNRHYGFVRGGIWQITRELGQINQELGVDIVLSCTVQEVDRPAYASLGPPGFRHRSANRRTPERRFGAGATYQRRTRTRHCR